ncbi:MAG: hypothetical protein EON88_33175, partial [Brevundimonas sp.]
MIAADTSAVLHFLHGFDGPARPAVRRAQQGVEIAFRRRGGQQFRQNQWRQHQPLVAKGAANRRA